MLLVVDFFRWWYGPGWVQRVRLMGAQVSRWYNYFSVPILLHTLFAPWRQIITRTGKQSGMGAKFNAAIDNMVSRIVGFMVRVSVIVAACVTITFMVLVNIVLFILWPLLPLAPLLLVIMIVLL